ncbi:NADH-quinone oxidoreductase subunit N [Nocardioides marinisabuli]|uniref:NADH-quinone oxidoreductase subunit N n=1 Tax=Nocardioides marinisabuli TaxID=419476 RepID=A0A7Y9EXY4_9ACTN|nr:proton-conducting transporter membrane subunit [Nocardioides marinisabuli]NYD55826.1 NADH-quinone oxidoreductase subunit N [Nocardioides marinisabuli]
MTSSVVALLPELVLLLGAVGCLLLGSWTPRRRQGRVRGVAGLVVLGFLAATVRGLLAPSTTAFSDTFAVDEVTGLLRVVVGLALLVLLALAGDEVAGHPRESEVYVLLLLGADGVLLVGGSTDLAVLVVGFLLASIPLYGLIGLSTASTAPEAALKTYLVGALSGIVLMLGAAVLHGLAGSTAYADLDAGVTAAPTAAGAAGVVLVLVGLLFKAGAVPAHFWVPDAVQGSWVTSAAFLTTVPKLGAVVAIMRLLDALPRQDVWPALVAVLAAVSMSVGNLAALTQDDVRRLLGWSTISQVGYLLAVVAAVPAVDRARPTLLLFLAGYAVTNLACFAVLRAEPGRVRVEQWQGAARRRPALTAALGVSLLGLVGTPPTAVFVAKVLTIAVTWEAGLAWLAVLVAANTVLSLAYYLRWLAACLARAGGDAARTADARTGPGRAPAALAVGCAGAAVLLGLVAGPVLALAG